MLDAHPDLACPPETNVAGMLTHMAAVWQQFHVAHQAVPTEPGGSSGPPAFAGPPGLAVPAPRPGAAPGQLAATPPAEPEFPEPVLAGIRRAADDMIGSYLSRSGKRRFCDKSLGTAAHADLLLQLYPGARFICLYRHPMDMIASGMEACPWGLNGFGFEPYAASSPHNSVHALAHFWADNATAILGVWQRYPNSCYPVRYEDLVADPELVMAGIFGFVGLPPAPGVSRTCFGPERDHAGPADFKIWHTSEVSASSVGRGWSMPATMIGPAIMATMNDLALRLGYIPMDEYWGIAPTAPDLRQPGTGLFAAAAEPARPGHQFPAGYRMLAGRLETGVARITEEEFTRRWAPCSREAFVITATPPGGSGLPARWRVDLTAGTISMISAVRMAPAEQALWDVAGPADVWEKVVAGELNLSSAIRRRDLRYCEVGDGQLLARLRLSMLTELLAVGRARPAPAPEPQPAKAPETKARGTKPRCTKPREAKPREAKPPVATAAARPRRSRARQPQVDQDAAGG